MRTKSIQGAAALAITLTSPSARALDAFEIQVYQPEVNEAGQLGLEVHSNYVASGVKTSEAPELPAHHVLHETLEPSYGLTSFWELGGYLQTALRSDGHFDFAGVKVRSKFRLPDVPALGLGLAINVEVAWLPEAYDVARWGSEIRPVLEWKLWNLVLDLNPIVSFELTGPRAGIPQLEPALSVRYVIPEIVAIGIEYFAATGPINAIPGFSAQGHYLFETIGLLAWKDWELHFGIGEGLTPASNPLVFKMITGYSF